ncbi:MAG: 3'(2'),5'-bisphosphate nucleotidase CysQ [Kiloniellales bacterium]
MMGLENALTLDRALAERLVEIAEQAGQAILRIAREGFDVTRKADNSPVTAADEAAEAIILPALEALAAGVPIVAEERVSREGLPEIVSAASFWLVDPLDGTRGFVEGKDDYTVNIALVRGRLPVAGVVHVPPMGKTWAAAGSIALLCESGKAPRPLAVRRMPAEGATVVASRHHGDPKRLEQFLAGAKVAGHTNIGSSIKFCLVAAGEADIYPRFGRTMEWDTAAGHAVLLAAGGEVTTLEGAPLTYAKDGFENPPFVARGRS